MGQSSYDLYSHQIIISKYSIFIRFPEIISFQTFEGVMPLTIIFCPAERAVKPQIIIILPSHTLYILFTQCVDYNRQFK